MEILFGKTISLLSQALDYHARKHNTIVSNIANIDTPGYRARDAVFDRELALRIAEEEARNPGGNGATRTMPKQSPIRIIERENPVSIDKEMSRLAENTIRYNLGVELLARKLRGLKDLAREVR